MLIYEGQKLEEYKREKLRINPEWNHRDFVSCVTSYINSSTEKILAIGGLRGTGKTVGILQATENCDVAYLSAQQDENETSEDYIRFLDTTNRKIIIIDEYSWIKDREKLDRHLLTSVQNDKRIIITATESISLEFLNYSILNHRAQTIHTTMLTYEEYLRLYNREHSKANCKEFLMTGGLFKAYIIQNFDSAKQYIDEAIVLNLAGYLKNEMSIESAKTLTYSVIYKAICPSNLAEIPTLRKNHTTLENFLEQMGVHTNHIPKEKEIQRIADIFMQAGIIVQIPNFNENSEIRERYYIVQPSLAYQLIKATYGLSDIENSVFEHIFKASVAIQLSTNMLSDHRIYFYNNGTEQNNLDNKELDLIITDREKDFAYFFECQFNQKESIEPDRTLRSGYLEEHEFKDIEILGRYVVYNGKLRVQNYEVGAVIFTPIGNILDYYFEFEDNVKSIAAKAGRCSFD